MGGMTTPAVLLGDTIRRACPEIVPLYFELDGTFLNHPANLEPANLVDLQKAVGAPAQTSVRSSTATPTAASVIDEKGNAVTLGRDRSGGRGARLPVPRLRATKSPSSSTTRLPEGCARASLRSWAAAP